MAESALLAGESDNRTTKLPAKGFERLQELMRHGYMPDHRRLPGSEGLLLRHESAPDLIVRPDGTVDIPLGQPLKAAPPALQPAMMPPRRKRRWLKALLIVGAAVAYAIICMIALAALAESM